MGPSKEIKERKWHFDRILKGPEYIVFLSE